PTGPPSPWPPTPDGLGARLGPVDEHTAVRDLPLAVRVGSVDVRIADVHHVRQGAVAVHCEVMGRAVHLARRLTIADVVASVADEVKRLLEPGDALRDPAQVVVAAMVRPGLGCLARLEHAEPGVGVADR